MSRNGSILLKQVSLCAFSVCMAFLAISPSFFGYLSIFLIVLMSIGAMSLCRLAFPIMNPAKRKPFVEYASFWIKNFVKRKSGFGSGNYAISFHSAYFRQFNSFIGLTFNHKVNNDSAVTLLFFFSRPFAVVWLIVSVVVNTLNGMLGWSVSHVQSKIAKGFPSIANRDSSAAVIHPRGMLSISASPKHSLPNWVKRVNSFKWHFHTPQVEA